MAEVFFFFQQDFLQFSPFDRENETVMTNFPHIRPGRECICQCCRLKWVEADVNLSAETPKGGKMNFPGEGAREIVDCCLYSSLTAGIVAFAPFQFYLLVVSSIVCFPTVFVFSSMFLPKSFVLSRFSRLK